MFFYIKKYFNSFRTKINLKVFNADVNDPKSHFLHSAIEYDDQNLVKYLLGKGADINLIDSNGHSPIHYALKNKYSDIASLLIDEGATLDNNLSEAHHLLHKAAMEGSLSRLALLTKQGLNINSFDEHGFTPIYYALANSHNEAFKFLLNLKPNLELIYDNKSLLTIAVTQGNYEAVKMLLEEGVKINDSPILGALKNNHIDIAKLLFSYGDKLPGNSKILCEVAKNGHVEAAKYALELGADINGKDSFNKTPLFYGLNNLKMAEFLCASGADVNLFDKVTGDTLLHQAVKNNLHSQVLLLLKYGALIDTLDSNNKTSLYYALELGNVNLAKTLISYGAKVNTSQIKNSDLLIDAVKNAKLEAVEFLVKIGLDINKVDKEGFSPIWHAFKNGDKLCAIKLIELGAKFRPDSINTELLHNAARSGKSEVIPLLIKYGVKVDALDNAKHTAIYYAIKNNDLHAIKLLINNGANLNKNDPATGKTLLSLGVESKSFNVVKELLNNGANPDIRDNGSYQSPIVYAIKNKYSDISNLLIKYINNVDAFDITSNKSLLQLSIINKLPEVAIFLISRGANIKVRDVNTGESTLHLAAKIGSVKLVKQLIDRGIDLNVEDCYGKTAKQYAVQSGHTDVVNIINDHEVTSTAAKFDLNTTVEFLKVFSIPEVFKPHKPPHSFVHIPTYKPIIPSAPPMEEDLNYNWYQKVPPSAPPLDEQYFDEQPTFYEPPSKSNDDENNQPAKNLKDYLNDHLVKVTPALEEM